jgi:hypothetical protein
MRRFVWVMVMLGIVGCSASPIELSRVDLAEFSVTVEGELLQAGLVDLSIGNFGQYPHTLVISTVEGSVLAATDLILAGERRELQIDLAPGDYMFTCRIVNSDGEGGVIDHYQEGMSATVAVVSPSA